MAEQIVDGRGTGNRANVDSNGRLSVLSISFTEQENASIEAKSFQIGSGVVNLTSASESALIYIKNNEDRDLLLTGVNVTSGSSTGGTGNVFLAKVYLSGTALSAGTSASALNNNFGSSTTLSADITQGQEAATVTNGVLSGAFYIPIDTFFNTDIAWTLPKGTSVAISGTPPAGNTSWNVTVTLEGNLVD